MIIIWRGAGILVLVLAILSALVTNVVTSRLFDEPNYFQSHSWAQAVSLWIAAAGSWFIGRHLNGKPGRTLTDNATGEEVTLRPNHHLLFIKLEYWGPILFVVGACVLLFRR